MFKLTPFNRSVAGRRNNSLSDFVDDFFSDDFFPVRNLRYDTFKVDIKEDDDSYTIYADMPGIKRENIKLNFEEGVLNISVNIEEEEEKEENNYVHRERRAASMMRNFNLGDVKTEAIEAKLNDGVLEVYVPKNTEAKISHTIEIK